METYEINSLRCLGMDPGLAHRGWGVAVKSASGSRLLSEEAPHFVAPQYRQIL